MEEGEREGDSEAPVDGARDGGGEGRTGAATPLPMLTEGDLNGGLCDGLFLLSRPPLPPPCTVVRLPLGPLGDALPFDTADGLAVVLEAEAEAGA